MRIRQVVGLGSGGYCLGRIQFRDPLGEAPGVIDRFAAQKRRETPMGQLVWPNQGFV